METTHDMIDALTMGIGAELGRPIRWQFFQQRQMLERNASFSELSRRRQQFAVDLLALAIFHGEIILPLHGSANFLAGTRKLGVSQVRLGSSYFTKLDSEQVTKITRQFFALVSSYGLQIAQLTFTSPDELIAAVRDFD